jgi:hypothetical protein
LQFTVELPSDVASKEGSGQYKEADGDGNGMGITLEIQVGI